MLLTLFVIGLFSGIVTGLLSVGGGIILICFLMILPPLISNTHFPMKTITCFSIMQAFFTTLSGGFYYVRNKLVAPKIVAATGIPAMVGGIIGVLLANHFSDFILRIIFASFAVGSAVIMHIPNRGADEAKPFSFTVKSWTISICSGFVIGILGGLVGVAAGFIFVPMMTLYYKLPIKKAIGTSLITCFLLSIGSLISKLSVGVIPFTEVGMLIIGGIIGAQIGGRITKKLSSVKLKRIAAYSILLVSFKLLFDLLF
ncbi:sulfite exporter TauE/SafE family protein [Bacillus salipaludis]|uniref:sulfite exporter TauE/SafE family protein n=1 Tax=Bacillus salipaludis TaxID=2547811 RepID=UPI003D22911B